MKLITPETIDKMINEYFFEKTKKKRIVFSGGGVKGITFIGVLNFLEKKKIMENIDTFVGTSIGSIIQALYVIGYSSQELFEIILQKDFTNFMSLKFSSFLENYCIDNGSGKNKFIEELITKKNISPKITLEEIYIKTGKKLVIAVTCLNTKSLEYISYDTYPEMKLLTALEMTSAIPFYFPPVLYNKNYYVDGGCIDNYPISYCKDFLFETIGVCIKENKSEKIENLETYFYSVIDTILDSSCSKNAKKYKDHTIIISNVEISMIDFSISNEEKKKLFSIGEKSAEEKFKNIIANSKNMQE